MRQSSRITFRSIFRIKVYRRADNRLIGYAGDVSECGMKLLADHAIEPGSRLELSVQMRDHEGQLRNVHVDMLCQWCQENPRTGHHETGLALQGQAPAYVTLVERIRSRRKAPAADTPPVG